MLQNPRPGFYGIFGFLCFAPDLRCLSAPAAERDGIGTEQRANAGKELIVCIVARLRLGRD